MKLENLIYLLFLFLALECNQIRSDSLKLRIVNLEVIQPTVATDHSHPILSITFRIVSDLKVLFINLNNFKYDLSKSTIVFRLDSSKVKGEKIFLSPFNDFKFENDSDYVVKIVDSIDIKLILDSKRLMPESIKWHLKKNKQSLVKLPYLQNDYLEFLKTKEFEVNLKINNCFILLKNYNSLLLEHHNSCFE
ncbi:MAG: hypothetical protein H6605_08125 [Flavobacteriales bacterium]|nr:hypothetical protein [Flavobacteriales bacterium]